MLAQLKRSNYNWPLDSLSIWSITICGFEYRLKVARNKDLSSETRQSILVLRNEGYSM
jgi:hypothetical protein